MATADAAHYLRDEARAAYFRFELLQAPEAAGPSPANG
jgi:hypothetical protein